MIPLNYLKHVNNETIFLDMCLPKCHADFSINTTKSVIHRALEQEPWFFPHISNVKHPRAHFNTNRLELLDKIFKHPHYHSLSVSDF